MTPFRDAKFDGVRYAIEGQFGGVCTRVGSTYVWEWAPRVRPEEGALEFEKNKMEMESGFLFSNP